MLQVWCNFSPNMFLLCSHWKIQVPCRHAQLCASFAGISRPFAQGGPRPIAKARRTAVTCTSLGQSHRNPSEWYEWHVGFHMPMQIHYVYIYLVGVSLSLHTSLLATKSGWMLLGPRSNNTGLKRMYQETMISVSNKEPVAKNLGFYMHHSCTSSGWKPMFWHSSINLTLRPNRLTHDPPHPRIPPPYLLSWRSNVASSIVNIYMSLYLHI